MAKTILNAGLLALTTFALSACGGGGGGDGSVVSTPAPSPNPGPTPTPSPAPAGPAGSWSDTSAARTFTDFDARAEHTSDQNKQVKSVLSQDRLTIRYEPAYNAYVISVPEGEQLADSLTTTFKLLNNNGFAIPTNARVVEGVGRYANIVEYFSRYDTTLTHGLSVFGPATPATAVPVSGSANYAGIMVGVTDSAFVRSSEDFVTDVIAGGSVSLNLNFAAGSFSGFMNGQTTCGNCFEASFPQMSFTGQLSSSDRSLLSGSFLTDLTGANSINGQFAGPQADEIMARFTVPVIDGNDGRQLQLSGVWHLAK